jgi:hypothetical protein
VKKTRAGLKNRIAKKPQNKYSHVTIPSHSFIYFLFLLVDEKKTGVTVEALK